MHYSRRHSKPNENLSESEIMVLQHIAEKTGRFDKKPDPFAIRTPVTSKSIATILKISEVQVSPWLKKLSENVPALLSREKIKTGASFSYKVTDEGFKRLKEQTMGNNPKNAPVNKQDGLKDYRR